MMLCGLSGGLLTVTAAEADAGVKATLTALAATAQAIPSDRPDGRVRPEPDRLSERADMGWNLLIGGPAGTIRLSASPFTACLLETCHMQGANAAEQATVWAEAASGHAAKVGNLSRGYTSWCSASGVGGSVPPDSVIIQPGPAASQSPRPGKQPLKAALQHRSVDYPQAGTEPGH
jgi:hypothetical protein